MWVSNTVVYINPPYLSKAAEVHTLNDVLPFSRTLKFPILSLSWVYIIIYNMCEIPFYGFKFQLVYKKLYFHKNKNGNRLLSTLFYNILL